MQLGRGGGSGVAVRQSGPSRRKWTVDRPPPRRKPQCETGSPRSPTQSIARIAQNDEQNVHVVALDLNNTSGCRQFWIGRNKIHM